MPRSTHGCCHHAFVNWSLMSFDAGAGAAADGDWPSRGKNATADAAPAIKRSATVRKSGRAIAVRRSLNSRPGSLAHPVVVCRPDVTKIPMTQTYVPMHKTQPVLSTTNDA